MPTSTPHLLAVARGDVPADLLLANGRVVNVFTGEVVEADVAIAGDRIAGVGTGYRAQRTVDLKGAFVAPGLIDAHVHIESSLCTPRHFGAAVVARGVTTVVADPHEIANVCGAAGVRYMAEASDGLPLRVVLMAPSCVPATPMATAGAALSAFDLQALLRDGVVHGLAEVMNFPGVISGSDDTRAKIGAFAGRPVDGHAPGVNGMALDAYAAAGILSDHECVTPAEATERIARGLYVLIREATNARNLDALLPAITPANSRRFCFCTDDRTPGDLLNVGTIDHMVRRAIERGIAPIDAIRMATLNPSELYGLHDRGAIAPGRLADLIVFDDLNAPTVRQTWVGGRRVETEDRGSLHAPAPPTPTSVAARCNVNVASLNFRIPLKGSRLRAIVSQADQLLTLERIVDAAAADGHAVADASRDLLKMAVIDRHTGSGRVGLGFITGFGLRRGAIAGTVAHDHHNLVVIGADDASMMTAALKATEAGGGLAVAVGDRCLAHLPLEVAGLMSDTPAVVMATRYAALVSAAHELGSSLHDPFMAMSFMALEVIPKLKLTDRGLVDVEKFELVELFV